MKLAFFTPLNPIQSGISDYSEELLLTLSGATAGGRPVNIDIFIDRSYKPSNQQITGRFSVRPARDFPRSASTYDTPIYQVGNSPAHAYIYDALLRHPGVVVMHEFVLHHLRMFMALNHGKRKAYLDLMERRYGDEGREAARRVMLGQFPEALFNYPLSDEVINQAQGIIVHSEYMAGLVRGVRPDAPLAVVPMGVPLPPYIPKQQARARLGIDPDLFLITSVGHLNPYKRVPSTLRAFKALLMDVPNSLYLLVGSRSPNYDPTRQVEMLGLSTKVKTTGYATPADFADYLAASDVCLNLRYPTAGETSASLLRIMGAGVPVLVSRTGSFEELPDGAAGKIDVGDIEEDLLLEYLLLLARRPDLRAAMSQSARQYIATHHTLEAEAQGYLQFIASLQGSGIRDQGSVIQVKAPITTATTLNSTIARAISNSPSPIQSSEPSGPPSPIQNSLSPIAQAAAELGIEEDHDAVLQHIARALEGLV